MAGLERSAGPIAGRGVLSGHVLRFRCAGAAPALTLPVVEDASAPDVDEALRRLRRLRDPGRRAAAATALLEQLGQLEREVSAIRDDAVRRLRESGESYGGIASRSGLTRTRVVQLLQRGQDVPSGDPAAP